MLTKELITRISEQTGATKKRTEELLNATTSVLVEHLLNGQNVTIQGLGSLEVKMKNARTIVHPKTGERTIVPAKQQIVFKPTASSKNDFN